MSRLRRFWRHQTRCRAIYCKLDWLHHHNSPGERVCEWCEYPMPEPRSIVGLLHPDQGE